MRITLIAMTFVLAMLLVMGAEARYSSGLEIAEGKNITLDRGFIHNLQGSGLWNPTAYGAIPDDGIDDAAAIQDAIDAASVAGGGIVFIPPGRYDLNTSQSYFYNSTFLEPRNNTTLIGVRGATVLRCIDNYRTPWRGNCFIADLSENFTHDWSVSGITFDGNGKNNLIDSQSYTFGDNTTKGAGVFVNKGGNITIRDCEFRNISGFNVIFLGGYGDSTTAHDEIRAINNIVENNYIWCVGDDISGNDLYDFSAIYLSSADSEARNNFISATTAVFDDNMCGIEIHSPRNVAVGNTILNYPNGVYLNCDAAYNSQIDTIEARDNTMIVSNLGIVVWGNKLNGHYDSILIEGNHIMVYPLADNSSAYGITHGSFWNAALQMQTDHLTIQNNEIEFYDSDVLRAWTYGIYTRYANNTVIKGNVIHNTTFEGISCRHYSASIPETIDISGNTINQFGTTTYDSATHYGILDWISYNNKQSTITGNTIICDPVKTPNYNVGIGINGANDRNVTVVNNAISGVWFETYCTGTPTANSHIHIEGHRNATPTVSGHSVGSIMWNTAPTAGAPPGWVCTTAGKPGTWKAMANLSA